MSKFKISLYISPSSGLFLHLSWWRPLVLRLKTSRVNFLVSFQFWWSEKYWRRNHSRRYNIQHRFLMSWMVWPIGMPSIFVFLVPKTYYWLCDEKLKQRILTDQYLPFIINWNFASFFTLLLKCRSSGTSGGMCLFWSHISQLAVIFLGTLFSSLYRLFGYTYENFPWYLLWIQCAYFWCIAYLYIFFSSFKQYVLYILNEGTINIPMFLCSHFPPVESSTNKWWSFLLW